MIVDNIKNIKIYKNISEDLYVGLKFISEAKPEIELGEYQITPKVRAIITEYRTVECFTRGFEAHRNVIDIQYPIIGLERIKWSPIEKMSINIPYDVQRDRTFYKIPSQETVLDIGNGIFAIMFPDDGHSPQHYVKQPELIKKVTVKVSM